VVINLRQFDPYTESTKHNPTPPRPKDVINHDIATASPPYQPPYHHRKQESL
ncbi:hypothetical protein BaRGS_00016753, partial [Batillaria attramentaria]